MRKSVLLIDDSEEDIRATKAALRDGSLSNPVNAVHNATEAKKWFSGDGGKAAARAGLVMVNIYSPKCEGLQFLEWLREQPYFSTLLVVALTERNRLRDVVKAYERGAHTFFVKPVHMEDIKTLARTYPQHCG
jgi:two-component system, chemotaxis family, response regulator Rcp1